MKASELMINDLARTNRGEVIKVESISTKRQHRKVGYHSKDDAYHIKYVRQSQIEPIPLTEEILKANGFETSSLGLVLYPKGRFLENGQESMEFVNTLLRKDGTLRSIEIDVFRFHFQCDYKFLFVHELQRILRSCDLCDIADNFKLE